MYPLFICPRIIVDLLKMNVAPQAVFQTLKAMCAGQRIADACAADASTASHPAGTATASHPAGTAPASHPAGTATASHPAGTATAQTTEHRGQYTRVTVSPVEWGSCIDCLFQILYLM